MLLKRTKDALNGSSPLLRWSRDTAVSSSSSSLLLWLWSRSSSTHPSLSSFPAWSRALTSPLGSIFLVNQICRPKVVFLSWINIREFQQTPKDHFSLLDALFQLPKVNFGPVAYGLTVLRLSGPTAWSGLESSTMVSLTDHAEATWTAFTVQDQILRCFAQSERTIERPYNFTTHLSLLMKNLFARSVIQSEKFAFFSFWYDEWFDFSVCVTPMKRRSYVC